MWSWREVPLSMNDCIVVTASLTEKITKTCSFHNLAVHNEYQLCIQQFLLHITPALPYVKHITYHISHITPYYYLCFWHNCTSCYFHTILHPAFAVKDYNEWIRKPTVPVSTYLFLHRPVRSSEWSKRDQRFGARGGSNVDFADVCVCACAEYLG